jgi:hypothetical protein
MPVVDDADQAAVRYFPACVHRPNTKIAYDTPCAECEAFQKNLDGVLDAGEPIPMCPWPGCPGFDPPADLPEVEQRLQASLHINNCLYRPAGAGVRA